jgi:hypothetical protein
MIVFAKRRRQSWNLVGTRRKEKPMDLGKQLELVVATAREAEAGDIMKLILKRTDVLEQQITEAIDANDLKTARRCLALYRQLLQICDEDIKPRLHRKDKTDVNEGAED